MKMNKNKKRDYNKRIIWIGRMLVLFCVLWLPFYPVNAEDSPTLVDDIIVGDIEYYLYSDGVAEVNKYNGTTEGVKVVIPQTVSKDGVTYTVKIIGESAFESSSNITAVQLPNTITAIYGGAFWNCQNLQFINLPEGLIDIRVNAFSVCPKLQDITFPDSLQSIGTSAFNETNLSSVTIPAGVTMGENVFTFCHNLKEVVLEAGVTEIGESMFSGCDALTSLDFLEQVTTIGKGAFSKCTGLTSLTIPSNVKTVGKSAFGQCTGLTSVVVCDGVESIGNSAFSGCTNLKTVEVADSVTSIGNGAFYGCTSLKDVKLSKNITALNDYIFDDCSSLETITIPEGVTSIGGYAFSDCTNLNGITIPEGVTSIGDCAFMRCTDLEYIVVLDSIDTVGGSVFYDSNNIGAVYYPLEIGDKLGIYWAAEIGYEENEDGTLSLIVIDVPSGVEELQIVIPETIEGKAVSSIRYGEDISEDSKIIAVTCTAHYSTQYGKDADNHWYASCNLCGEEKVVVDNHNFGDGKSACICGYVPFTVATQPKDANLIYGYAKGMEIAVKTTATIGTETITYQWYENGKSIEGATEALYTVPIGKKVGEYTYYCKMTSGAYSINSKESVVTVSKKPITVQVNSVERKYGEDNPTFTYTMTEGALVAGDTTDDWQVNLTTTATKDAVAGTYKITGTITSDNYEVTVEDGVLTIKAVEESDTTGGSNQETADKDAIDKDTVDKDTSNQDSTGNADNADNQNSFTDEDSKAEYTIVNDGKNNTVIYEKSCDVDATTVVVPISIVIGDKTYQVTCIAKNAFRDNKKLTKVTIGSNIITIGDNAFRGCANLKTVVIGKNVETIGNKAFYKCTSLATITIPSKVKKIGKSAFEGCKKLKKITIKTKLLKSSKVGKKAFKGIKSNATIKVPKKKYKVYKTMLKKKGVSKKAKFKKN